MQTRQTVTFATANLFNFVEPPGAYYDFENIYEREAWQHKCHWTQNQLSQLNADVVGLQEVFSIDAARDMMCALGYRYFATVDEPHVADEYIYSKPVVAIASKYPISECKAVTPLSAIELAYEVDLPSFSRPPICATVLVPDIGHLTVYVCHLKSQRATEGRDSAVSMPLVGRWLSSQQRGWEAVMLYQFMANEYDQQPVPTVLLGDMNQSLTSDITSQLTSNAVQQQGARFCLKDSWELLKQPIADSNRPATHYHFAQGNVLDYILLSPEFHPDLPYSMADVTAYTTLDQHLINPKFATDRQASDHAFVSVTVEFVL
ncbi:endonuclease/exonuclease/phosphatase family protein [Vibrio hippocampi]|uniref:Endonuclease/exonuclease/phosphatase domain-containing protein n=1 Tax=Vibrio hippocampi TaxID=654686 RepID=A0ABM8ZKW5_9VIBR|nr:endonuclease/exonuclease/phosphatase family protein [Vibrio hippocampi]CAH0528890.1 hypothetical protein VHP8226_02918 [Vibrio hippocampi]